MPTNDEIDAEAMDQAQESYLNDVIDSYKGEVSPKTMDTILARVQAEGSGAEGVERMLAGHVRMKAVKAAGGTTDLSELEDKMEDMIAEGLKESGWDPMSKPEVEEEEEPEPGQWRASEGDSWPVIAERFNDGSMSLAAYEAEREARGMEALH